ncbi:hypothetical protein POTOM_056916 [Populus tomentosa]|uniref:Endonuclease/exonuclease/phosphatase domain-containing protein n=1 Tax=Populus tomentosa TaxID=118781 RepID=A0A8X7XZW0_POPTO|nr:hypothetical protein POTOM_056916 [Populus tomentosa]
MKRSAPPVQFLAAAFAVDSASMSSRRPPYRGSNNRNQWVRTFSNGPYTEDSNLGFLQGEANHNFTPRPSPPPPPRYYQNQQFRQPPPPQPSNQNRILWYSPPFNQNHHRQFFNQNHRLQRPAKPLDYRNWEYAKTAPPRDSERFKEVDRFGDLEEVLKVRGYSGIWKMRTGNAIDGCAVFWRTSSYEMLTSQHQETVLQDFTVMKFQSLGSPVLSRFRLVHEESIEFNKHGLRDNVAQICVLELIKQDNTADTSTLPTSSTSSNKVLICNIHVLYNPKRGDIKLGQVRMLLDRAHAVSKTWNDAPVILCGDFNCTPKVTSMMFVLLHQSPLYNFISEQKLDFSGIDRGKVSGQASAEICHSRPYNFGCNPNASPGTQSSDNSVQAPLMVDSKQSDTLPNKQKQNNQHERLGDVPSVNDYSQPKHTRTVLDALDVSVGSELCVEEREELYKAVKQSSTIFHGEGKLPVDQMSDEMNKSIPPLTSHPEDAYSDKREQREGGNSTSLLNQVSSCEHSSRTNTENIREKFDDREVSTPAYPSSQPIVDDEKTDLSPSYQVNISDASVSYVDDKLLEDVSLQDLNDLFPESRTIGEDQSTFLSALHGVEGSLSHNPNYSPKGFASDPNDSQLDSPDDEVLDDFPLELDSEGAGAGKTADDPSLWTPMEIVTATGNVDCMFVEHPLKLKSTYTQVEDCYGTRDPHGEPLVTSYNRCFFGTVDYIWYSEGLQTVKVLAPMAKHAMQWTAGFPTKFKLHFVGCVVQKWGSDHIALASEFAFTKDGSNNNMEVQ